MTIILIQVDTETGFIEENFFGVIAVQETTAATMTETILRELRSLWLDINDFRCQGYL
jgi:hypothetical protein